MEKKIIELYTKKCQLKCEIEKLETKCEKINIRMEEIVSKDTTLETRKISFNCGIYCNENSCDFCPCNYEYIAFKKGENRSLPIECADGVFTDEFGREVKEDITWAASYSNLAAKIKFLTHNKQ